MAYTIKFLSNSKSPNSARDKVLLYLQERMKKEGVFTCKMECRGDSILISRVRLVKSKPYCGNHPGECPVSTTKKPKMKFL